MADRLRQYFTQQKFWWLQVVLIWAATRTLALIGFLWAASLQGPTPWTPPGPSGRPGYFDFLNFWDSEWYQRIFDYGLGQAPGYPTELPVSPTGAVEQNAWAFMPGFPALIRVLTRVLLLAGIHIDWKYLASTTSLVLSFALALAMYKLFRLKLGHQTSLWAVTLFGMWVASPVLQTPYAESLGLLTLTLGLYFLIQHKYLAALPWLAALSITRPGMLAFALTLAGMWIIRWRRSRNSKEQFPLKEKLLLAALTAVSTLLGFAWPIFAWIITGRPDAYTLTELAWRTSDPNAKLVLFKGWADLGSTWFGPFWGTAFVIVSMVLAALAILSKPMRKLGSELQLWCGSYLLYIFAVFHAQSSTWRIMMMAFPLIGGFAVLSKPWTRFDKAVILLGLTVAQFFWLHICWLFASPDYTPP